MATRGIRRGPLFSICVFHILLSSYGTSHVQSEPSIFECSNEDKKTLLEFKKTANVVLNWSQQTDCCTWKGVGCEQFIEDQNSSHVFNLSLPNMGLEGEIPSILGNLVFLQYLNLSSNQLNGSLPNNLSSLQNLKTLDISNNKLSGNVIVFEHMVSLESLDFSRNNFSGGMPSYLGLIQIEEINGSHNTMQGEFPSESLCENCPQLKIFDFSFNKFSGSLPNGLSLCMHLEEVYLASNMLIGSIPKDLFNITSLSVLCLDDNKFTGELDDSIGMNLHNLTTLFLCNNNFSGNLPTSLSQMSKLRRLVLSNNNFTGSVEFLDFSNFPSLEVLDLHSNAFSGSIPTSLQNCTSLQMLILSKNLFSGEIPNLRSLKNLSIVSLSSNRLLGTLDSVLNCENLVSLVLTKNQFSESLPSVIGGLQNVQILALGYLNLRGKIPTWLLNCTKLQVLDLSWNHLGGEIPLWLGSFPYLMYLELSNNSFTGTIPSQLFSGLSSMIQNDTNTTSLQNVSTTLDVKRQTDSPGLMYSKAMSLPTSLYLSNNHLMGPIPVEIGLLTALVHLDLSHNELNGTIPEGLGNLTYLEVLDLSYNHLSGPVPSSLTNLTFLGTFNVSYNNLSGQIPMSNQFTSFPNSSYEGNPGLCGRPVLGSCANEVALKKPYNYVASARNKMKNILVPSLMVIGLTLVLSLCLFGMFLRRNHLQHQRIKRSRMINTNNDILLASHCDASVEFFSESKKLSVEDMYEATNNFDSANIVGCGGFGLVYRAELKDGSCLAIKKLTGDCGQMEREFRAEVDVLSKVQHTNLVSLQGYVHFSNQKFLIYSYMENGSLDYWLHERNDGRMRLDWPMRLNIARGAAAGLAYLHEVCIPHIVHRDIKSSNILLDEHFEASLADFGLARLLMTTDTHVTTELVGTLGYIPPEYGEAMNATRRGDVYSFGVVLLELLTGRRPVDVCKPKDCGELVSWVQEMRKDYHKLDQVFDSLLSTRSQEQMIKLLDVAIMCIDRNPINRPFMRDVVNWLNRIGEENHLHT